MCPVLMHRARFAVFMVKTETVNDNGFNWRNYDLPMHNDIQWNNENNSNAEVVD
jgi:hypothetical protein